MQLAPTPYKDEKLTELLKNLGAQFLSEEANRTSLLTVTRAEISSDRKYATIFFTVFPESAEATALDFTKRKRRDFKDFVRTHSRVSRIPFFDFAIDYGEKNRQRIDEISQGK